MSILLPFLHACLVTGLDAGRVHFCEADED